MKDLPGGSYPVMKSNPRVTGDILLMAIVYKYNPRKLIGFIDTEGGGSTETDDPCLCHFTDIYSNVSVHPVVRPRLLGSYFNSCDAIQNKNSMRQSELALDKYWGRQSLYFRLAATAALDVVITDGELLLCHGISEGNVDKKFSTIVYNNRTVYECFNNPFPKYFFAQI